MGEIGEGEGGSSGAPAVSPARVSKGPPSSSSGRKLAQQMERQQVQQTADERGEQEGAAQKQDAQHAEQRLHEVLLEAFAAGTEGVMLKRLDAGYEPSKRSEHWVKLKRDYCEGLHDTLDLVPIGAWYGNGRKVGWFSPFLMAVYDPQAEQFQSLCRCMSGFSDAFYREATARLSQHLLPSPKPYYRTAECPDVWFEAREVWEIRGADLSISPVRDARGARECACSCVCVGEPHACMGGEGM